MDVAGEQDTLLRAAVLGCDLPLTWADARLHDNGYDDVEAGIKIRRRKGRREDEKQEE